MNNNQSTDLIALKNLITAKSKHSDYQSLHPTLFSLVPEIVYRPTGKYESQRMAYMTENIKIKGQRILDIGANTGYFSFAAIEYGARQVVCQEGNREHAEFIELSIRCLGLQDKVEVRSQYFDFFETNVANECFDLALCLNVLHHLGDDFGDAALSMAAAKEEMIKAINRLALHANQCWMQLGFNWKGDRNRPLFPNGTKKELIDFVRQGTGECWEIVAVGAFNPNSGRYEKGNAQNLQRFEQIGEFLNRPIFLLRSKLRNEENRTKELN